MEGNQNAKEKNPKLALKVYVAKSAICQTLNVSWDGDDPWTGESPTSQKYDFWLYKDKREIWHYADDLIFTQATQSVEMKKDDFFTFIECWNSIFIENGEYKAKALFCASEEEIEVDFSIRDDNKGDGCSPFPIDSQDKIFRKSENFMISLKCIDANLYEGDITYVDIEDNSMHMILAFGPTPDSTPCLLFQSLTIFGDEENITNITSDNGLICINFLLEEKNNKKIESKLTYADFIEVHVKDGPVYKDLPWFNPKLESDMDWIVNNLKIGLDYNIVKTEAYNYEIRMVRDNSNQKG